MWKLKAHFRQFLISNRNCDTPKCIKDNKGQTQTGSDFEGRPLHVVLTRLRNSFTERQAMHRSFTEQLRKSFVQAAVQLF